MSVTEGFQRSSERRGTAPVEELLAKLHIIQREHRLWSNPLLTAFAQGALTRDDLRYVFSQYHLYSKNFTRFIAAVMANCDNDLFRAQLSENLWEEGGGCEPERRHAQLYRNFMRDSLGVDKPETIDYAPYARHFVREYLVQCLRSEPMAGAAFLSLGTEGIVARLYETMLIGMRKAGLPDGELEFFHIHVSCDDEHAKTLERMMTSYAGERGWYDACVSAMDRALELRNDFFTNIFEALQKTRLQTLLGRIQRRESLAPGVAATALHHRPGNATQPLYKNKVDKLNVEFAVERLPVQAEVLDPRMVRIPAGKFNEKHKHAHETLIHILTGSGRVLVDDQPFPVQPGDTVLVPRWALHQTQNTGDNELRFLAVTDYNLTQRAFVGDPTDYRLEADADAKQRR